MYSFRTVSIRPRLPRQIEGLGDIARNFWFSWNVQAQNLFKRINEGLWEEVRHNPVKFLLMVNEEELEEVVQDDDYLKLYRQVMDDFNRYLGSKCWFENTYPEYRDKFIAYFSLEFGLHESHPIYSGGLGLLAGDHMKSASDLGLPFVGVGLLYKHGYFNQIINREGGQEAKYPYYNFYDQPIQPVYDSQGDELVVRVEFPGRDVCVKVWKSRVGRVDLLLLDAGLSLNSQEDRAITGQLYGGDRSVRISQEILLGIGGVRVLKRMGVYPRAWHINEGHAAFLIIERLRELMAEKGLSFETAIEVVKSNTIFTTHTPVPAGHDLFPAEMMDHFFGHLYDKIGVEREDILNLAWDGERKMFNMTLLALRHSAYRNGVSRLHGEVSREMFSYLYPKIPKEEVPVSHVTNGVHVLTWLAQEIKDLYTIYLGSDWQDRIADKNMWKNIHELPENLLWVVHQSLKEKMIGYARNCLKRQRIRNQEPTERIREAENFLRPGVLTVGFARRFATYKRAGLLFRDPQRLSAMVNHPERPVQFIFAGKAHPADMAGQDLIKLVYDMSNQEEFKGKIVFLEDYNIDMARYLVHGVDVWLNTPRRPLEASGTSGQKAAINGVVNVSVPDGWWPEGYNGKNGFAVGEKRRYSDDEMQDRDDCYSLYTVLEEKVIPVYYRQEMGFPGEWVKLMKNSMRTITPLFSTGRMVMEYTDKFYIPCIKRGQYFSENEFRAAEKMREYKQFMSENWSRVEICLVDTNVTREMNVGEGLALKAHVALGAISPGDVDVEVVYGSVTEMGLHDLYTAPMLLDGAAGDGRFIFTGQVTMPQGTFGYTVRVRPGSPELLYKFELPLVTWAERF
ncbi:MAG: alpha-glucan phosphorylase [Peptococcaceae bacterium BRH_c4a]|nr:MAG: alpha-glucan phosphorylase [Peptococcaceae bacterium BRH_c4a]